MARKTKKDILKQFSASTEEQVDTAVPEQDEPHADESREGLPTIVDFERVLPDGTKVAAQRHTPTGIESVFEPNKPSPLRNAKGMIVGRGRWEVDVATLPPNVIKAPELGDSPTAYALVQLHSACGRFTSFRVIYFDDATVLDDVGEVLHDGEACKRAYAHYERAKATKAWQDEVTRREMADAKEAAKAMESAR